MRSLRVLLGVAALLLPAEATRAQTRARLMDGHPLFRLVERERAPRIPHLAGLTLRLPAGGLSGASSLDCVHARHDIQVDPTTGATSAALDLEVRATGAPLDAVGLVIDQGLAIGAARAEGRTVTIEEEVVTPSRLVRATLSPPLEPGESTTLHVSYAGSLACAASADTGALACVMDPAFAYFAQQSIFPLVFDPAAPNDPSLDLLTRDVVLRVPAGAEVVSTGERVSETVAGGVRTSTWTIDRPLSRALGMYAFAGKLGRSAVPGRSVPTTLVYPAPEQAVDQRLLEWSTPVLDFVEKIGGERLPFQRSMTLVRLPSNLGDPGTATFGMTLLSEAYARAGDLMHEETWSHENAHLFWGIVVPEKSPAESRLMTEGLATLTALDYTYAHHFAGEDRDRYLARRFVPIGLDLRAQGKSLPPVQLAPHRAQPDDLRTPLYTLWAYYKTAATLDHLRESIGEDAFARSLGAYVEECRYVGCTPDDLERAIERTTGRDMAPFFDRWIKGSARPTVTVAVFGAGAELVKDDDAPMTLVLWIRLEDDRLIKRRVELEGRRTTVHVDAPEGVRSVSLSPRHDVLVDSLSTIAGDLDFDGESDGFDMLRCSRLVGTAYRRTNALGLWNVNESFDPRCDVDGDLAVDDDDLLALARSFGSLRERER